MHDHKGIFCMVLLYDFGTALPHMAYSCSIINLRHFLGSWPFTASWHDNLLARNTGICEGSASNFWLDEVKRGLPMKVCPYANFQAGISGLWSRTLNCCLYFCLERGEKSEGAFCSCHSDISNHFWKGQVFVICTQECGHFVIFFREGHKN